MIRRLPALLPGLGHGVSDAAAGFLVGTLLQTGGVDAGILIFIYNGLAFGLQPVAGLIIDRVTQPRRFAVIGLFLTACGLAILSPLLRLAIAFIGIGSAFYHAAGGAIAIKSSPQRSSGPGVFAAFGVIGLAFGMRLSLFDSFLSNLIFALVVLAFALAMGFGRSAAVRAETETPSVGAGSELWIILLIMAFAFRSFVWSGVDKSIDDFSSLALWVALAAGAGKFLGGFASDRFGWKRWAVSSLAVALILLAFGRNHPIPLLLGVFLLQSVTALTVAAFGRLLPESPALAASLGFGAAVIVGGLPFLFIQQMSTSVMVPALALSIAGYWVALRKADL